MAYTCRQCKYGLDATPDGRRSSPGTVWCSKRRIAMGQQRSVSCFVPLAADKGKRCQDCKWARMLKPIGGTPEIGKIWCEKRHSEINKLRTMECFE